ncbi:MAG TPA: hypothetical protein VI522_04365, partial [Gammaproteobacteria bacterium]|nr:hypothetical protein [Gammaproteobacteria bacterium]
VTPPSCVEGPTSNDIIHRELFLNIASQQEGLTQEVHARVTVIGSGREFSVLDINNPPETNQALGHSQLFGDLGILSAPWLKENQDGFEVIAGTIYTTASPTTDAAHSDFLAAYNTLRDVWDDDGCREHGSIDNGDAVQPGYYCLSYQNDDGEPIDVTLSGEVLLEGPGNFIFFIGAGQEPEELCGDDLNPRMCDLIVRSTARFTYKNASPQDVYWVLLGDFELEPIMGKTFATPVAANYSNVYLSANSTLHGTVLAGAPGSSDGTSFDQGGLATITAEGWDFPVTGNGGAVVHGRLWAYSAFDEDDPMPAIRLASTTVDAHAID